jgi:hypothetical protein
MRVQCNACRGEYDTEQPDGLPYFHVCPGVPVLEVQEKDGSTTLVKPGDEGDRPVINGRTLERPTARDERPVFNPDTHDYEPRREGAGVTPLEPRVPRVDKGVILDEEIR